MNKTKLKTIKLKTINGDIAVYKNCIEFCYGRNYLVLILLETKITSSLIYLDDILSFELKGIDNKFKKINVVNLRRRLQRKYYERSTTYN